MLFIKFLIADGGFHHLNGFNISILQYDVLIEIRYFSESEIGCKGEVSPCQVPLLSFRFCIHQSILERDIVKEILAVFRNINSSISSSSNIGVLKAITSVGIPQNPHLFPTSFRSRSTYT